MLLGYVVEPDERNCRPIFQSLEQRWRQLNEPVSGSSAYQGVTPVLLG